MTPTVTRPIKSPLFRTEPHWLVQQNLAGWTTFEIDAPPLPESAWEPCHWRTLEVIASGQRRPTVFLDRKMAERYREHRAAFDKVPVGRYRVVEYYPQMQEESLSV